MVMLRLGAFFILAIPICVAAVYRSAINQIGTFHEPIFDVRYVARVMYDGTSFRGWQEQGPKLRTVIGMHFYCCLFVHYLIEFFHVFRFKEL